MEVALALGVMGFALAAIIGMIPFGLSSFRQAMNNTVEAGIVQTLTNEIFSTEFSNLRQMSKAQDKEYYYNADGEPLETSAGALYTAQVSFTDLSPETPGTTSPLGLMTVSAGTTALIAITKIDKTKDYFSLVVGNNRAVAAPNEVATW